jgi:hypothetical protein
MLRLYSIFENYKAFVHLNLCYNFKFKLVGVIIFDSVFIYKKRTKPKFIFKKTESGFGSIF